MGNEWKSIGSFAGNFDRDSKVKGTFKRPVRARYVRIYPLKWHRHISMRAGLTICLPKSCETEAVKSASSGHSTQHRDNGCQQGGLDSPNGWCAAELKQGHWYQMDAGSVTTINGVVTQGRHSADQWVTRFAVVASQDGNNWWSVGPSFAGNSDRDTKVTNVFRQSVTARYVRIMPLAWNNHMSLRAGLVVCTGDLLQTGCMEKNVNHEAHGKVSSQYNHDHCRQGALDSPAGWCSKELKAGVWYQMDAGTVTNISGVVTQGRHDACVYAYLPSLLTMADVCVAGPVRVYLLVPSSS